MKRYTLLSAVMLSAVVGACADDLAQPQLARPAMDVVTEGETYLVRFGNKIDDFNARVAALGGEVVFAHAGAGIGAVTGLSTDGVDQLAGAGFGVASDATVEIDAQIGDVEGATVEASLTGDAPNSPAAPNLSFFYPRQWGMRAIQANQAWAAGRLGSSAVKIGVLDTGLDYLHPDLVNRVDLALSRSFLSATENARVQTAWPGAHPVADLHYHGTHVGSTIASNGLAAAGVTSATTLVGLKVCHPGQPPAFNASCPNSGTYAAILYAADNGIPVINMSLGGTFNRRAASARGGDGPSFIAIINDVFNYAHQKGTQIIVSAGNSAINMQNDGNGYKTYCDAPHVICVSATGPTAAPVHGGEYTNPDALAPYSNYGGKVTVAAPGGSGTNAAPLNRGWVYQACSGFNIVPSLASCRTRFYNPATGAWSASVLGVNGTSMASPHAAGVAAYALANGATNVRAALTGTADDLGKPGQDPIYGQGRVNAMRAAGL